MTSSRYVVLGLAPPRARWYGDVARWATGAALPIEFVKCVTAQEVRVRVESGRRFSAALLDAGAGGVDRDLVAALRDRGAVVIVVSDGREATEWVALGATAVLPEPLRRADVLDVLARHATMVRGLEFDALRALGDQPMPRGRGRLVAVTGPAGVGATTTAVALAQGLATRRRVLLADLCLVAEMGMVHDADDVVPGLPELVEAHRTGTPEPSTLTALTWRVEERRHDLLLGLRRPADWTTIRGPSLEASLRSLRRGWDVVVADVDACVEGDEESGSNDVADRHRLARTTLRSADRIVLVARPGLKWLHGAVRVLHDLVTLGVEPTLVQVAVVGAGRRPRARAQIARAVAELAPGAARPSLAAPVFLPSKDVDRHLRDGTPLPSSLAGPLASAVVALLRARPHDHRPGGSVAGAEAVPRRLEPGELGIVDEPGSDLPGDHDGEDAA